ncbi:glycosyltransferase [Microbulbifer sp. ANSA002]|uniref:glycosyltransferase n=1 Tax=unclassified Microbulbifer TaxID=2619833 RepID=UPI004040FC5C
MVQKVTATHCYRTFLPETQGGVEQAIFQMARGGGEVLSLSSRPGSFELDRGLHVRVSRRWFSIKSMCFGPGLILDMWRSKARVLHLHFPWPFGDIVYLLAGRRRPLIVTYHSDVVRQKWLLRLYTPFMNRFFAKADRIVATSEQYVKTSEFLKRWKHKVSVIPLGIDEDVLPLATESDLERFERAYGRGYMLFVGVLRYYKGLEYLIRAAEGLGSRILIAGVGPEERRMRSLVRDLGLTNVEFLGFVSEKEKSALYQLCGAVVFPSHLRSEAFGVTLIEGLMAGKPLISCEIGTGTSFVNQSGVTGHVVQPADVNALRCAMLDLIDNQGKARDMGLAARKRYEELFTGKVMRASYQKLYREVLGCDEGEVV